MSTLGDIRQRAEAATEGPWAHEQHGTGIRGGRTYDFVTVGADDGRGIIAERSPSGTPADAEFIAHARTDIPRLLAALDAVEDQLLWFDAAIANNPDVKVSARVAASRIRTAVNDALEADAIRAGEAVTEAERIARALHTITIQLGTGQWSLHEIRHILEGKQS